MTQIDSVPKDLTHEELVAFEDAIQFVIAIATQNAYKHPKMTTLLEEFAEAVLASRGKHDDPLKLEIGQIGGIAINLVWQIILYGDESVANLRTYREDQK